METTDHQRHRIPQCFALPSQRVENQPAPHLRRRCSQRTRRKHPQPRAFSLPFSCDPSTKIASRSSPERDVIAPRRSPRFDTVPVRIVNINDAQAFEAQLVENLHSCSMCIRLKKRRAFELLLNLERTNLLRRSDRSEDRQKNPLMLPPASNSSNSSRTAVEAFYTEEIGVGHALLLAKLPPDQQESVTLCLLSGGLAGRQRQAETHSPARPQSSILD